MRRSLKPRLGTLCLCAATVAQALGCAGLAPIGGWPRGRWVSGGERGSFVFGEWTGVTGSRTVYDWDNRPVEVAVLEEVRGPHLGEIHPPGHPLHAQAPVMRTEQLANANKRLLLSVQVPPGLPVRVDGFKRPEDYSGRIINARTGHGDVARGVPRLPGRPPDPITRFQMIKVRRIWETRPDGTERPVWETNVPFRGL